MRRTLLALMIALALLAAPIAFAKGSHHEDDDDDDDAPRVAKTHAERNHTSDKANRTADRVAFRLFVDDWHDNATQIREACQASHDPANNSTTEKQCVRDGYRTWWNANWEKFSVLAFIKKHARRGHRG